MTGIAEATVEIIRADVRAHTSIEWQRVEGLLLRHDALAARVRELEAALGGLLNAVGLTKAERTARAVLAAARRDA